jgi:hypothetical protein
MTSPSAMVAAAEDRMSSARSEPTSTIIRNAQEVADENAGFVAPHHAGRELAAAQLAFVDHVVVQQCRGVHEFHRSRELDVTFTGITGEIGHRQRQHRAQPLAAGRDQVVGDIGDHRDFGPGPRQDGGVDALHVGGDEFDELVN